jgi:hypothetical protein
LKRSREVKRERRGVKEEGAKVRQEGRERKLRRKKQE